MIPSVRDALLEIVLQQMQLLLNALGMQRSLHGDMESLLYTILTGIVMHPMSCPARNSIVRAILGLFARRLVKKYRLALPLGEPTLHLSVPLEESIEGEITIAQEGTESQLIGIPQTLMLLYICTEKATHPMVFIRAIDVVR